MRALKALVIFMSVLIVAGIALLAYGLIVKLGKATISEQEVSSLAPALPARDKKIVTIPNASRFEQMEIANSRIVLRFATQDAQLLLFVDPVSGEVLGPIVIAPDRSVLKGE